VISIESEDTNMSIRRKSILTTLAITLIATAPAWSQSLLKTLDPDNDGTVDLAEAKSAASKVFDKLDRDHDGTLDKRELRGRVSAKDFAAADPDNDGTLDKMNFSRSSRNVSRLPTPTMTARLTPRNSGVRQAVPSCYS
jgi:Ca2+-binding EF-hand superfamily protein